MYISRKNIYFIIKIFWDIEKMLNWQLILDGGSTLKEWHNWKKKILHQNNVTIHDELLRTWVGLLDRTIFLFGGGQI